MVSAKGLATCLLIALLLVPSSSADADPANEFRMEDDRGDQFHPGMDHLDLWGFRVAWVEDTVVVELETASLDTGQQSARYGVELWTSQHIHRFQCFIGDANPAQDAPPRCDVFRGPRVLSGPVSSDSDYIGGDETAEILYGDNAVVWQVPRSVILSSGNSSSLHFERIYVTSTLTFGIRDAQGGFVADFTLGDSDHMEHLTGVTLTAPASGAPESAPTDEQQQESRKTPAPIGIVVPALLAAYALRNRVGCLE